jgi:hypothetical protein
MSLEMSLLRSELAARQLRDFISFGDIEDKGKIVLVLNYHAMKTFRAGWRGVVKFTPRPFLPPEKGPSVLTG